jgi:predicted SAM-dependent methyltransferase
MKLHLGCGKRNFGNSWIHVDKDAYPHVSWNSVVSLPFDDQSCDLVYASHLLEYFDRGDVVGVINEWKRVLKTNGILRIAVPDFEVISKLYVNGEYSLNNFLGPLYGKMGDPPVYHKTTYDFNSLSDLLLNKCAFESIHRYDWRTTEHSSIDDHSQAYLPHMDKTNGVCISLNVEAVKGEYR